jgi:hypothetical protein
MLITIALTAAMSASVGDVARKHPALTSTNLPPIAIRVYAAPTISSSLVAGTLDEASEIWRDLGLSFEWKAGAPTVAPYMQATEAGPYVPATLRVVIGDEAGVSSEAETPLGWIRFDDVASPEQEIHVSRANAMKLLELASGLRNGRIVTMPRRQQEDQLSRAMGRALAHELGHYLLASKKHTHTGLMQGNRSAYEFFTRERNHFDLNPEQLGIVATHLRSALMASR